jgi:hypothetical protein
VDAVQQDVEGGLVLQVAVTATLMAMTALPAASVTNVGVRVIFGRLPALPIRRPLNPAVGLEIIVRADSRA